MRKMKNQKGVTLVALVVTIIVLIILAGISINLILGDNGIVTIAKKTKENMELAKVEEERELNELYTQLETGESSSGSLPYDSIVKLTEFKTAIANAIGEAGGIKPDVSAETAIFEDSIKGIVKEVTQNATATADNITEGKTAWVNGELITGTFDLGQTKNNKIHVGTFNGAGGIKSKTFNVKSLADSNGIDYTKITKDDFWIKSCNASSYIEGSNATHSTAPSITYNNSNGEMTVSGLYQSPGINRSIWVSVDIWLIM